MSKPEPLEEKEIAKPTSFDTNKYAPQPLIGEPTVGVEQEFVTTVGLGRLQVTTANGFKDDGNTDV